MTSARPRLSRVSFGLAITVGLAAAPASAAGPAFLKFGGVEGQAAGHKDHKGEIEILSYSWGAAGKDMTLKGKTIGQNARDGRKGGNVEFEWKVEEGESAPPRPTRPTDVTLKRGTSRSGEKGGTEDINIGVGELQEARPAGGVRVAAGDVDGDGRAGANEKMTVHGNRTESGQATGKRQHMPLRSRMYYDQPQAKGSVWVRVASPWNACRVGARYPSLELGEGTKRYVLQDVTVASCGSAADDRPPEEVAFYYNRIAFNYAN